MRVTLSAAVTADGFMDSKAPERLMISTPEDWREVYRLRAVHDAILVGAETLRRDNPSLRIHDEQVRTRRKLSGAKPDIAKVTLTATGQLAPTLRFFTEGNADHYIFSARELPELKDIATVICTNGSITARQIVTDLEKRGVEHLFVEGGARTLRLFLDEGLADTLRIATNPALRLGIQGGCARFDYCISDKYPCLYETFGDMEVATWELHPDTSDDDLRHLKQAIAESRHCTPSDTSYCVGAVIVSCDGRLFTGYTHETTPTHHAEQEAITKALAAGATLRGASIYSSMEPCSTRSSEPESCTQLILRHGFAHVAFALYEPNCFVCCQGALTLREAGVDVRAYPSLAEEVRAVNAHLVG